MMMKDKDTRYGKWLDNPYERWKAYDIRSCSICGWFIHKNKLRKSDLDWNYCPNCGANMKGETENENV